MVGRHRFHKVGVNPLDGFPDNAPQTHKCELKVKDTFNIWENARNINNSCIPILPTYFPPVPY